METRISLALAQPRDLLPRVYANGRHGGLRLDGPPPGPLGWRVQIRVEFAEPAPRALQVMGLLAWARHRPSVGLPAGYGVDFLADDEAARRRLLLYASGRIPFDSLRFETRHPAAFPVQLRYGDVRRKERLKDLSEGGAFVVTQAPLPVGTNVQFALRPRFSLRALKLDARVAWVKTRGEEVGMGLQFLQPTAADHQRLRELVAA